MWPSQRQAILRVLVAILCVVAAAWLALWYFIPAPPNTITLVAGIRGGAFEHFANSYRQVLARHHVKVDLQFSKDAPEYVRLIKSPKSDFDAAFMIPGVTNSNELPDLLSLGRINYAPVWIFYRGEKQLDQLTQLKGKRISIPTASLVHQILAAYGVNAENTIISRFLGIPEAAKSLRSGEVDAIILPPLDLRSPGVESLLHDPTIRLMNVAQAEAVTRLFPSVNRAILPQGVIDLEKNIPASDVNLVASSNSVVVRKELHPDLIYLLAQTLKEVHGGAGIFQNAGEFPTQTDPEFPVAEEASDYYKSGPSLLQRYLPFWMISHVKRIGTILVAVIAIAIPMLTYAPKLYDWFLQSYLKKLYRQLMAVEMELEGELTAPQIKALQTDLENIKRASSIVPLRHADLFFGLRLHIKQTHADLNRRLIELGN